MADVYAEKATWFTGMANEVRRLSETEDKLTPADMLAKMQDMTLGGGGNGLRKMSPCNSIGLYGGGAFAAIES